MSELFKIKPIQQKIALKMGAPELCCQTAEELAELTEVLMQFRRVSGHGQPTDKGLMEVREHMQEEIVDSIICIKELIFILGLDVIDLEEIEQAKIERTAARYGMNAELY